MHSALVIVESPKLIEPQALHQNWHSFVVELASLIEKHSGIERLADSSMLIAFANGADALAEVLALAAKWKKPYRVLFFKKEPRWVRSSAASSGQG